MSGEMRVLTAEEKAKYGCKFCTEHVNEGKCSMKCKHEQCLYKEELDKFDTYRDYERSSPCPLSTFLKDEESN